MMQSDTDDIRDVKILIDDRLARVLAWMLEIVQPTTGLR